jgi:DNA-binding NtrC family response regulator
MSQSMNPQKPLLIVDDEEAIISGYREAVRRDGINNAICLTDSREALDVIADTELDAAVLDLTMPHVSGEALLDQLALTQPDVPVIVITGKNDVESAMRCIKKGAHEYLVKPVATERILSCIRIALGVRALRRENQSLHRGLLSDDLRCPENFSAIITANAAMKSIFKYIEAIAPSPYTILLSGETGVGKELFARAIHKSSKREGAFVAVNVAGLDDNAFADTLFGHKSGAYTGADSHRPGLIASASKGTLFLDEIGDLSISSQIKLLRVLQEGEYLPLGEDKPVKTDARVIVATNVDLLAKQENGGFRADLYYRLNTHKISVPPLRDRLSDLPLLIDAFLAEAAEAIGQKKPTPPSQLVSLLSGYSFPGNIRELQAMIADAVSSHTSHMMSMKSFRDRIVSDRFEGHHSFVRGGDSLIFSEILPRYDEVKTLLVEEALVRTDGNHTRAADLICTSRQAVWRHIKKKRTAEDVSCPQHLCTLP